MPTAKYIFLALLAAAVLSAFSPLWADPAAANHPSDKPAEQHNPGGLDRAPPKNTGQADPQYWQHFSDEEQIAAVDSLKAIGAKASDDLKHHLNLQESHCFLLYSDVTDNEATRYSLLLEHMYAQLADLFGLKKGQNIWRGKALVFIFLRVEDYRLYERLDESNDPGGSYAMTHCFGDGMVHIAYYCYPGELEFEHLLVHESVHGFLHRYRTPARIPSWANEGLADELASEQISDPQRARTVAHDVRVGFEKHNNSAGEFFTANHIDGWQYPLAESLTAWMIARSRQGYLDFINGIKDGQAWDKSLHEHFKLTPDQMLAAYAKENKIKH